MTNFKLDTKVCIDSLTLGHSVELTFFEGKLDGFLVMRVKI